MRNVLRFQVAAALLLCAACGGDGVVIRGSLGEEAEACADPFADRVYSIVSGDTSVVRGCAFRLVVRDSGSVTLAFDRDGELVGRMRLTEVPGGARLALVRIAVDERGLAFPSAVQLEGAEMVEVNGIRMGDAGWQPRSLDVDTRVLSVAVPTGLLLVRPLHPRLPDLRVRVDSATRVRTTANEPGSLEGLEFGDSVRVQGTTRNGVVVARQLTVPEPREPPGPAEQPPGIWEEVGRLLDRLGL